MTSSTHGLKTIAGVAIVATGLIHFVTARDSFGEATYKGLLFVANGVGALVAAVGVYRERDWGWLLAAVFLLVFAVTRRQSRPEHTRRAT